jgi:error-prone DNA polymerase
MIERGYDPQFAQRCFEQIKGFSGYGFPESHAASFALLVYVSSWLKKHYPAEFAAALINSQPMGFYAPAQIVRDAQEHGVTVLPVDVNRSAWDCTIEKNRREGICLRLGLRLIRGLSETDATSITEAVKRCGPFQSIETLHRTSGVRVSVLRRLAGADAFNSMDLDRQHALWQVRALRDEKLPIFDQSEISQNSAPSTQHSALPPIPDLRKVAHDYAATGLSLRPHPVSFIRDKLTALGAIPTGQLKDESRWPHGKRIAVAGLTLVRQRPSTANGIVFMTIEDETGIANLIIRPDVYARCRKAARHGVVVLARGRVERQGEVVHVLAFDLQEVSLDTVDLDSRSRDFH